MDVWKSASVMATEKQFHLTKGSKIVPKPAPSFLSGVREQQVG